MKRFILFATFMVQNLCGEYALANDFYWSNEVANYANTYFKQKYQHDPNDKTRKIIQRKSFTVNRPNHGLAHGMRQGFLASDIIFGMRRLAYSKFPITNETKNFINWINNKINTDKFFTKKVQFVASFQRTGRGSEISVTQNPNLYNQYKQNDANNFDHFANIKYHIGPGKLFKDLSELQLYKEVLYPEGKISQNQKQDWRYLSKIINASHQLDLRRMCSFDPKTIQDSIQQILFGTAKIGISEQNFLSNLWNRSGEYLNATGDRDVIRKKTYYSDRFYTQAHNVKSMVSALHLARKYSTVKF